MKNLKNIDQFNNDTENISENKSLKGFSNFDSIDELKDFDLSKDDIIAQRDEIANKINKIEGELNVDPEVEAEAEESVIDNTVELEMELESLKKDYKEINLLAEKKVFTHKAIVRK